MDRTHRILDALTTPAKQRVLSATLLQPHRAWYLHELSKHLGIAPSTVQHELRLFTSAGLLTRREHGNRVYYQADRNSPVLRPLAEILMKTAGLVDVVQRALQPILSQVDLAFIYGSVASGEELSTSDIDLMIVGAVPLSRIAPLLTAPEEELGRSINPTVYTSQEFLKRVKEKNHFLTSVLKKELLFIHGTADDLAKLGHRSGGKAAQNQPKRAGGAVRRGRARPGRRKNS